MLPGAIITFYSFKGGTGRTMALANAACLLAAAGHSVLAIDWDLEAPGLHRFLHPFLADPSLSNTYGLIDLFWDYALAAAREGTSDRDFEPLSLADPAHAATPTSFQAEGAGKHGCLHIIGAGMQNAIYGDRVRGFNWGEMFSRLKGEEFVRRFGKKCRERYEYTLIDSRTGIADTAGIATITLPDRVVLCFTPNRQSVLGVRAVGDSIMKARPSLRLLPVVTRVEKGVEGCREAQAFYRTELDNLLPAKSDGATGVTHGGKAAIDMRAAYWGAAEIVHYPNYALGELLAVFCDSPTEQNSLLSDMRRLVSRIVESGFMSSLDRFAAPELSEKARSDYSKRVQFELARARPDASQRATKAFLEEYLASETGRVPFGGRDHELERLDAWLDDPRAAPRMLLTAPAGRGKSALLVQWMKSLQDRGLGTEDNWRLAFIPVSIRFGTNRPSVFLGGLAHRLAEITDEPVPREAIENAEALKYVVEDQLETISSQGQRVLVVLDGLDEAPQGSFDPSIIPPRLPESLRVLVSARRQVGDSDSAGWLRRLGWDRGVRVETLELERLAPDAIADVLLKLGAPTDVISRDRTIVRRLFALTEGEPILLRFYAEDLWELGQHQARITIANLDSLQPGIGSYFERWLSHQERLWVDEGTHIERIGVDRVLSILAFALGPLESRDLLELMKEIHQTDDLISEHDLLQPLRRFVMGNGQAASGYVLSHPRIGDYLQHDRFRASAATLRRGFATWGQKHLRALNSGDLDPLKASPYALQFLKVHFGHAELPASLDPWGRRA
jgi:hypothetical protein